MKKILPFAKEYTWDVIGSVLCVIAEVVMDIRIPYLMSKIIDIGIANNDIKYIFSIGAQMVLMALLALICGVFAAKFSSTAAVGFAAKIRKALFDKVQNFSFANTDHFTTPSLVTRLTTDVINTQNSFIMVVRMFVRAPVMMISAIIMAATINSQLVLVFLVAIPLLALVIGFLSYKTFPIFRVMLEKYDKLNASIQENLTAIRVVKAFVRAKHEKDKFNESNDDLMHWSIKAERFLVMTMPAMTLTVYACIIAILWFGGNMIVAGTMLTGELISFISYVMQILMSLMMLSMVLITVIMSRASISRINEILDEEIDIKDDKGDSSLQVPDGSIEFKNVCFKYNENAEQNILEDINLKIEAGKTVGVIGGTGSAKTTLVQLIPRLYDVSSGSVIVGNHNVKEYTTHNLRNSVSMVLQKNTLFSGTIEENLRWGSPEATQQQLEQACKSAEAHDFIQAMPNGYKTLLGQGGVNLSGGQKQRLCIARALLKDPKIIIFDDSTSAVDTATEAKIREAWEKYHPDTTKIIIAQRISSVQQADMIIVIDDGKINAVGTHEELLKTNENYTEVYNSQLKGVAEQ